MQLSKIRVKSRFKNKNNAGSVSEPIKLLQEYTEFSTIHGIQHIFRKNETLIHRLIWTILFTSCLTISSCLMKLKWNEYKTSAISMVVKETNNPRIEVPFPGISFCPTVKINRFRALDYIKRELNDSNIIKDPQLEAFFGAMTLFQDPLLLEMGQYLKKASGILQRLSGLNLTDFMLEVLPKCEEIFRECKFKQVIKDCCGESNPLFTLQRSEEGFCYSFNSLTSEKCSRGTDENGKCVVSKVKISGPSTGVGVYLKKLNRSNSILEFNKVGDVYGYKVYIENVKDFPDVRSGILIPDDRQAKMRTLIKPAIIESGQEIADLNPSIRKCYTENEVKLGISNIYSQRACIIQCGLKYLIKKCGCLPYYFNKNGDSTPICNTLQIGCLADYNKSLKSLLNENEILMLLNCSICYPTCSKYLYEVFNDIVTESFETEHYAIITDFSYKVEGTIKYHRTINFGPVDFLVSCGGLCGLFLGGSLLSIAELIYWLAKAFVVWLHKCRKKKIKKQNTHKIQVQSLFWYN